MYYGLVKTHKANNPVRIITSGCNTAVENLSIFVEKVLYKEAERIPSRIKDTSHMFDIIDILNDSDLPENSLLVSFDVVNMFPSIDNESGIKAVKKVLDDSESKNSHTECILEALRLCLECDNSVFNDKHFIQTDGTAQGPHMSCSYSDILWLILKTELKITLSNPQFGNASEMMFFLSGHITLTLCLLS